MTWSDYGLTPRHRDEPTGWEREHLADPADDCDRHEHADEWAWVADYAAHRLAVGVGTPVCLSCGEPWPCPTVDRPGPIPLDGCTCGGIGTTGAHKPGCQWHV